MASYEIIIRNETDEDDDNNLAGSGKEKTKKEANLSKKDKKSTYALHYAMIGTAKEVVVSRVGEIWRDNLIQQKINEAMSIAQTAAAFAVNPALGAVDLTTKLLGKAIDLSISAQKETHRLNVMRERAGYINRSRDD